MKKIFLSFKIMAVSVFCAFALSAPVFAEDVLQPCNLSGASASSVCKDAKASGNPLFGPDGVLSIAITIMSVIVGIAAVIMIILAGLKYVTSGSNPQEVSKAREMILYAIVGLIIAAASQIIVRIFINKAG